MSYEVENLDELNEVYTLNIGYATAPPVGGYVRFQIVYNHGAYETDTAFVEEAFQKLLDFLATSPDFGVNAHRVRTYTSDVSVTS